MRRICATLLFAAIVIGGTRPQMLAALKPSWRTSRRPGISIGLWQYPLRFARDPVPEAFIDFFEAVERRTPADAPIAVVVPPPWDNEAESYSRFRFGYLLAGHTLVIVAPWTYKEFYDNAYVAAWHMPATSSTGRLIYSGHEGILRGPNK